jgi:hypothetical protein
MIDQFVQNVNYDLAFNFIRLDVGARSEPAPVAADDTVAIAAPVLWAGARPTWHWVVFAICVRAPRCPAAKTRSTRDRSTHPDQIGLVDDVLHQADRCRVDHLAVVGHGAKPLSLGFAISTLAGDRPIRSPTVGRRLTALPPVVLPSENMILGRHHVVFLKHGEMTLNGFDVNFREAVWPTGGYDLQGARRRYTLERRVG